jgi:TetR/AcrR family transcriptional repressor of nem operon
MFRERGFDKVTVAEVMKEAGLTHGAFYSHFKSKEDLMVAAIKDAMQSTITAVRDNFGTDAGRIAYINSYLSTKHRNHPGTGCAIAALCGEVRLEPGAKEAFTAALKEVVAAQGSKRDQSILTVATLVGAMMLARAVSDERFSNEILWSVASKFSRRSTSKGRRGSFKSVSHPSTK